MNNPSTETGADGVAIGDSKAAGVYRALRTWPAIVLVGLMLTAKFGPMLLEGGLSKYWMVAVFGPLLGCALMAIWWVTLSRATWRERLFGLLGLVAALALTSVLVDPTMRGPGTTYLTLPMGMIVFALASAGLASRRPMVRTGTALVCAFVGFGFSILLRNEGMTGDYQLGTHWRWTPTAEAMMLAGAKSAPAAKGNAAASLRPDKIADSVAKGFAHPEWPAFRGGDRAGRARGPRIATDWAAHPPELLWKIPVGPGWSSFAVAGQRLFTQEQRGPMETVVCYDAETGREIWKQQIEARFDDALGGPGPRATPTLADGGLYAMGATGTLLRLDPATGEIVWKQDITTVPGRKVPMWGFAASPLVTGGVAIVYAGGTDDLSLLGFDTTTGALRWSVAAGTDSYASPQWNTIAGEALVLMLSNNGLVFVEAATGKVRLNYEWKFSQYRALQPHVIGDDTILLPTGMNTGTRAIQVSQSGGALTAKELWTSRNLKTDFTDLVTYQGHAYGNDAGLWTCLDLKTGDRKWKGGRYGKGQALLLESSGMLLIAAEQGQVALVPADPTGYREVAAFKALEGKTWNHPVVVGDRLYVRNAQEAAAYRLPLAEETIAEAN